MASTAENQNRKSPQLESGSSSLGMGPTNATTWNVSLFLLFSGVVFRTVLVFSTRPFKSHSRSLLRFVLLSSFKELDFSLYFSHFNVIFIPLFHYASQLNRNAPRLLFHKTTSFSWFKQGTNQRRATLSANRVTRTHTFLLERGVRNEIRKLRFASIILLIRLKSSPLSARLHKPTQNTSTVSRWLQNICYNPL